MRYAVLARTASGQAWAETFDIHLPAIAPTLTQAKSLFTLSGAPVEFRHVHQSGGYIVSLGNFAIADIYPDN